MLRAVFNERASERASKKFRGRIPTYLSHPMRGAARRGASIIIGREEIKRSLRGPGTEEAYERGVSVPCSRRYTRSLEAGRLIIIRVVVNANGFCGL